MPETPDRTTVAVSPAVLVLAVRCALSQRTHDDDLDVVAAAVDIYATHLPADVLRELDNRITYWLDEQPFPSGPRDRWLLALQAVRQAREETER